MADRSASVPMTLSDLERRDAIGVIFFRRISLITLDRLTYNDQIRYRVTQVKEGRNSRGQPRPKLPNRKWVGPKHSQFWGSLYICGYTF